MITKLTQVHTTVNELCEVFNIYGKNYDKDKAYTDDIQQEALKVKTIFKKLSKIVPVTSDIIFTNINYIVR